MARDAENTPLLFSGDINQVNANIAYEHSSGRWSIIGGGTNLTDNRYIVSGTNVAVVGAINANYSPPRQWYITLRLKN
jgi:iron complex outermembrane receptor protein